MENKLRRGLALLMTLIMLISCAPMDALAAIVPVSGGTQTSSGVSLKSIVKPPVATTTYVFMNGKEEFARQILKNGETLNNPGTPDSGSPNKEFTGWRDGDNNAPVFGAVTVTETKEFTYHAQFADVYYVYFLTTEGSVFATEKATAAGGYKVSLAEANKYEPKDAILNGWVIEGTSTAFTAESAVGEDTRVTPVTTPAFFVTFNTNGGTGVPSQYVTQDGSIDLNAIPAPTKVGYTFGGWKHGEEIVTGSFTPNGSTTLSAVWNPAQVKYLVSYWGENANDDKFEVYLGSEEKTALTGTEVSSGNTLPSSVANRKHFTFMQTETKTVAADGSTVINAKFTRNKYKVTFNLGRDSSKSMTIGGVTYTGGSNATKYVLQAKFEQNIEDKWPTASNFTSSSNFYGWRGVESGSILVSKRITMTDELCATNGKTATAEYGSDCLDHLFYMFESFDQTSPANGNDRKHYNGTYYDKSTEYSQDANSSGGGWQQKSISGMTAAGQTTDVLSSSFFGDPTERNVFLYYTRNSYVLEKNNYGDVTTETLKYGAPLDDKGATPARPAGFSDRAEFKGWYTVDPAKVTEATPAFTFAGAKMPYHRLGLYAVWQEPKIIVKITIRVSDNDIYNGQEDVVAGTRLADTTVYMNANTAIAGQNLILLKWVDTATGARIDPNTELHDNMTITPVFAGTTYSLTYTAGAGAGADILDTRDYGPDSKAKVQPCTFTAPEAHVFSHWEDAKHNRYYPGSYVTMNADVTLTAVYVPLEAKVSMTYYANNGTDDSKTVEQLMNNATVTLLTEQDSGFGKAGYTLTSWNTAADGSGTSFAPNTQVQVDNNGANVLYAIWTANTDTKYIVEFYY